MTEKTMQDVSIELHIANRKYPLKVKAEESGSVKKAAELINSKLDSLEKRYGVKDIQDLFAMSALQIATQLVELEARQSSDLGSVDLQLDTLINLIDKELQTSSA
jgi:cell division protein ZapA (FtsZ GTPase activity inhibitor)